MKDKQGNLVDVDELAKIILKHLKDTWKEETRNSGITSQGVHAHLSVYHNIDITVVQSRKVLEIILENGDVRVEKGHGSVRSNYILIKKQNSVEFINGE